LPLIVIVGAVPEVVPVIAQQQMSLSAAFTGVHEAFEYAAASTMS
jgi:hypothetical protein